MHIQDWIDEISKYTGTNICKLVIGNKADMTKDIQVMPEDVSVMIDLIDY